MNRNRIEMARQFLFDGDDEDILNLFCLFPRQRKSTHAMIMSRDEEGVYNLLIKKYLMTDDDKFMGYFRVSPTLFQTILNQITDEITTTPSNRIPKPISGEQKLCVALRLVEFMNFKQSFISSQL